MMLSLHILFTHLLKSIQYLQTNVYLVCCALYKFQFKMDEND